ncbi:MAG: DUF6092 family protein [Eubacteriales bacterium]|nr:DUF6092 family protein [Eubacteriales bacterium]
MNDIQARELLIYMLTSAAGLPEEPKSYGPLRMAEAASQLAALLLQEHPEDPALNAVRGIIEAGKGKNMADPDGFYEMLQEAVLAAVDLL